MHSSLTNVSSALTYPDPEASQRISVRENFMLPASFSIPPGIEAIYSHCCRLYPNQKNPLQVSTATKYWLGGSDPLDFVSMYRNDGDPSLDVPPHWHYVSMGLSDLYGDGRVHAIPEPGDSGTDSEHPSGYGFELTFRLKQERGEESPPTWPAALLQALSRYAINCGQGGRFDAGDSITWDCPLDGSSESRIREMLFAADPQLGRIDTRQGFVKFLQVVGICKEELQASQRWNGFGVLRLLTSHPVTGGVWHIADMRRGESIFELDPTTNEQFARGFAQEGSNLACVVARCSWQPWDVSNLQFPPDCSQNSGHSPIPGASLSNYVWPPPEPLETEYDPGAASMENVEFMDAIELIMDADGASRFPLMIKGRLLHGRHFTFKCMSGRLIVTFALQGTRGAIASTEQPIAKRGKWINILLTLEHCQRMAFDLQRLDTADASLAFCPQTFEWPDARVKLTIVEKNC